MIIWLSSSEKPGKNIPPSTDILYHFNCIISYVLPYRDADLMREKQRKKEEAAAASVKK